VRFSAYYCYTLWKDHANDGFLCRNLTRRLKVVSKIENLLKEYEQSVVLRYIL